MKGTFKKLLLVILVIAALVLLVVLRQDKVENFSHKYEGVDLTADAEGAVREGTYSRYLKAHADAARPNYDIEVDIYDYEAEDGVEVYDNNDYDLLGESKGLYTSDEAMVTWSVEIPESGFYNIYLEYLNVESRGVAAERAVYINGELPFEDSYNVVFSRRWTDKAAPRVDNQGNEIRPTQIEKYAWQNAYCEDSMGFIVEPYEFYFEKGTNTISMKGINEPLILRKLVVKEVADKVTYEDYLAAQTGAPATGEGLSYSQIVQGEHSTVRSESSLYSKYDKSAPNTSPYSVMNTILNYTGGDAWKTPGQWIEWEFSVPEDGYYNITIKGRQNYERGSVASRKVYIDGEIPFEALNEVEFEYMNDWNCLTLADENGDAYEFYLTEGTHTIRMEITLGGMGEILDRLEDSIFRLNQIYRTILVYTGATPDKYRDYNLDKVYPEAIKAMQLESLRLYQIVDDTVAFTGQKADKIATAQTLAQQLERFVKKPEKISVEFTTFKDNITALGTAMLNMSESRMDIDYIRVSGVDAEPLKDSANFFSKMWHEIKAFVASFIVDYDAVGDVYDADDEEVVKVWILSGRDQGTILKSMVDDTFTPESGIKVNVEIVAPDALLSAVMAGRGPQIVLTVGADQPVNYALRGSAEDLTQFEGWEEVFSNYTPSSYEQYRLEDGIYGLPETQTFSVMFYREDILADLGLEIPQTWDDLIEMLPTIQGNNMTIAIPTAAGSNTSGAASTAVASTAPDLSMYLSLLYQNGGDLYNEEGTKAAVDEEAGVEAFNDYTRYFNDYGLPTIYDFVSRFRSGEMPIGIVGYGTYNTLVVSAPEIRGLWDFTLIPGTERVDENGNTYIDRSDMIAGNATMMIKTEDENLKAKAWEFMKWWAQVDTQVRFGREIEALLGSSARYATANFGAFEQLAWSASDIKVLKEQWLQTKGVREVPGGYYTGRHITNAIRKVINDKDDPRETIQDYVITINEEITKKRIEFGLPVE